MLKVTETEACSENEKQNYLKEDAIYFHTKARRGRGKIPPPTPDYDINYGRSLKGLPEIHPEEIDDVPGVSENGIRFCIESLGEKLGCGDYEYDLIQFWFLDILTDCLWKAQDYFAFDEHQQKLILEWVIAFFKIIADPILNISRKSFLRFFKQVLLKMYQEIHKTCVFPTLGVMSEFLEVAAVNEQMKGEQGETESSTTTSTSNPSASTFTIHSRDRLKIYPDFDIKQHIKNLKSNNPLSNLYHTVSETETYENFHDFSQDEAEEGFIQDYYNEVEHYSNYSFTKNNFNASFIIDYPNLENSNPCYCKKHNSFFCLCTKKSRDDFVIHEEIKEIIEYLLGSIENDCKNVIDPSIQDEDEEIIVIKDCPTKNPKLLANITKRFSDTVRSSKINKSLTQVPEEQLLKNKPTKSSTDLKSKQVKVSSTQIDAIESKNKSSREIKTSCDYEKLFKPRKKPEEVIIETGDNRDEEELQKEKELLEEWAQFKLLEQRNLDMDNSKIGWVSWNQSPENSMHSINELISNISTETSEENLYSDSLYSEQRALNFNILKAIIDFVFEYFYENFHFTLIQLAFRSTPNVLTQKLNEIWNVPKTLKQEIKRPKPTPKKKEKKSTKTSDKKSKKKDSDKKSKSKSSKSSKEKKEKKKKEKPAKLTKEEKERLKQEEALLEAERRKIAENKLFMFPLADAASEDLFMSIFENWVNLANSKEEKKKDKNDNKKKK